MKKMNSKLKLFSIAVIAVFLTTAFTSYAVDENRYYLADSDNDGVLDAYDKCPQTPAGVVVNPDGCPEVVYEPAPNDTDGDGIPNVNDSCPNTPPYTQVDSFGCPM